MATIAMFCKQTEIYNSFLIKSVKKEKMHSHINKGFQHQHIEPILNEIQSKLGNFIG